MFIRDSRRSYRTYSYPELILITNLCLFGTPVGVIELILKLWSLHLFRDTRGYHGDYETYTGIAELILVLYRTYSYTDTGVPVGTTELILSLPIREYPVLLDLIRCRSTRRYHKT